MNKITEGKVSKGGVNKYIPGTFPPPAPKGSGVPFGKVKDNDFERLQKLVELKNEYIKLLGDEINDLMGMAVVHGWHSKRIEMGKILREKMAKLE